MAAMAAADMQGRTAVQELAGEVQEARVRIQRLVDGVLGTSDPTVPRRTADVPLPMVDSDSDDEVYARLYAPEDAPEAARARLAALMARLRLGERAQVLEEVGQWAEARAQSARQDQAALFRSDRECDERAYELEGAAGVREVLQKHEQGTTGAIRSFCQNLGEVDASRHKRRRPATATAGGTGGGGGGTARRPSLSRPPSASGGVRGTQQVVDTTTRAEDLQTQIEEMRKEVRVQEQEAWLLLNEVEEEEFRAAHKGRKDRPMSATASESPTAPTSPRAGTASTVPNLGATMEAQEPGSPRSTASAAPWSRRGTGLLVVPESDDPPMAKTVSTKSSHGQAADRDLMKAYDDILVYMRETIRESDGRAVLMKEALDYLGRGSDLEDIEAFGPLLRQEVSQMMDAVRADVKDQLLPGLLEERLKEHGDELRPADDGRLAQLQAECDRLAERIAAVSQAAEQFRHAGALEEDLAAQLRKVEAGEMPSASSVILEQLAEPPVGTAGGGAPQGESGDETGEDRSSSWDTPASIEERRRLRKQEDAVRRAARSLLQDSAHLYHGIQVAATSARSLQKQVEAVESQAAVYRGTVALLEEHRSLFLAASRLAHGGRGSKPARGRAVTAGGAAAAVAPAPTASGPSGAVRHPSTAHPPSPAAGFSARRRSAHAAPEVEGGGGAAAYAGGGRRESGSRRDSGRGAPPWAAPFLAASLGQEGEGEAVGAQLQAIRALREEEEELEKERKELEEATEHRIRQLLAVSQLGLGGLGDDALIQLRESAKDGRAAVLEFDRALRELLDVGRMDARLEEACCSLADRRAAVEAAKRSMRQARHRIGSKESCNTSSDSKELGARRVSVPTGFAEAVLFEGEEVDLETVLGLQAVAQHLANRLAQESAEVDAVRTRRATEAKRAGKWGPAARKWHKDQENAVRETRKMRQQTRAAAASRAELRTAVAEVTGLDF